MIKHTCLDNPNWDGCLTAACEACDQAVKYPCTFCGYGHIFTTHSDIAHAEKWRPRYS